MDNLAKTTPRNTELELLNGKPRGRPPTRKAIPVSVLLPPNQPQPDPKPQPTPPPSPVREPVPEPEPAYAKAEIKPPLKVAMIGTAPSSRDLAPFADSSWTIWACSPGNAHGTLPRVDAWFEIHSNLLWPECIGYGGPYLEWLKQQKFPIYMQDQQMVPTAVPLPINELVNEFGRYFFTSTFSYMLAMAIKMGAVEVSIFGVDVASKDEYILQRAGVQYFMQEAAKRGIKVNVPFESDLAQPPALYGYADSTPFGRKLHVRTQELKNRIATMMAERDKLNHSIAYLEGAMEDMDYVKVIWSSLQT